MATALFGFVFIPDMLPLESISVCLFVCVCMLVDLAVVAIFLLGWLLQFLISVWMRCVKQIVKIVNNLFQDQIQLSEKINYTFCGFLDR